ncbi:MAG: hypothetical protein Q7T50_06005, partial [Candidatus Magasanikbacteria bacterium]|nr:hypothetical protein [Candidatus Magasanikbacteria bacterium]
QFICDPYNLKLLHEIVKPRLIEFMSFVVSKQQKPKIDKCALIHFDQYSLYSDDGNKLPLRVNKIVLHIMLSMDVYRGEEKHYQFTGNYVSTYSFGEKNQDHYRSFVYVSANKEKGFCLYPNYSASISPDIKKILFDM